MFQIVFKINALISKIIYTIFPFTRVNFSNYLRNGIYIEFSIYVIVVLLFFVFYRLFNGADHIDLKFEDSTCHFTLGVSSFIIVIFINMTTGIFSAPSDTVVGNTIYYVNGVMVGSDPFIGSLKLLGFIFLIVILYHIISAISLFIYRVITKEKKGIGDNIYKKHSGKFNKKITIVLSILFGLVGLNDLYLLKIDRFALRIIAIYIFVSPWVNNYTASSMEFKTFACVRVIAFTAFLVWWISDIFVYIKKSKISTPVGTIELV